MGLPSDFNKQRKWVTLVLGIIIFDGLHIGSLKRNRYE